MKTLFLGGARSGKSRMAENYGLNRKEHCVYIATAVAQDDEMQQRIDHHKQSRHNDWYVIEEPFFLADSLLEYNTLNTLVLIDCLTLWMSNCLHAEDDRKKLHHQKSLFIEALSRCKCDVVLVSNEVGLGVVPMGELSRDFVNEAGWLHQELARICDNVVQVCAGLSLPLKSSQDLASFKLELDQL